MTTESKRDDNEAEAATTTDAFCNTLDPALSSTNTDQPATPTSAVDEEAPQTSQSGGTSVEKCHTASASNNSDVMPMASAVPATDNASRAKVGYYSTDDAANRRFREKCLASIEDPRKGPTADDFRCGLLGVEDYNEKNFPVNHHWLEFAKAQPLSADLCRIVAANSCTTNGHRFAVCFSDDCRNPTPRRPPFVFHHPGYPDGHPPSEILAHKKPNESTVAQTASRGRGRPRGARNKPKSERGTYAGVKPRKKVTRVPKQKGEDVLKKKLSDHQIHDGNGGGQMLAVKASSTDIDSEYSMSPSSARFAS